MAEPENIFSDDKRARLGKMHQGRTWNALGRLGTEAEETALMAEGAEEMAPEALAWAEGTSPLAEEALRLEGIDALAEGLAGFIVELERAAQQTGEVNPQVNTQRIKEEAARLGLSPVRQGVAHRIAEQILAQER